MRTTATLSIGLSLMLSTVAFAQPLIAPPTENPRLTAPPLSLDTTASAAEPKSANPHQLQLASEGINVDLTYAYLGIHVNHLPLSVRDVPIHPDDLADFEGNDGPIQQPAYSLNHSAALSIMYAWKYKSDDFGLNLGVGFDWLLLANVGLLNPEAERDYSDHPGSGVAGDDFRGTYVGLRQVGVIPTTENFWLDEFLNWTPRAKIEIAPFHGPLEHLWLGASISYYTANAQTGWDRSDFQEPRKEYVLAYVIPVRLYLTLFDVSDSAGFTAGVQFQPAIRSGLGRQSDTAISPLTFFFGYTIRF